MVINTVHEFYQAQQNNHLHLVPGKSTIRLMESLGVLMKTVGNRFELLLDQSRLESFQYKLEQLSDAQLKFSFYLYNKNPYFVNITDVPTNMVGRTFYCSNRHLGAAQGGMLHRGDKLGESELYNNYQGKEEFVERGVEKIELVSESNGEKAIDVSRIGVEEGVYKVVSDANTLQSVVSVESGVKGTPVALVDVTINKDIKEKLIDQLQNGEMESLDYTMRFGAREVFWNYIVVPRYQKKINKLKVVAKKGEGVPVFGPLVPGELNDGRAILSSVSKESVKYAAQYDYEIQLKLADGDGNGKVLVKRMPFAGIETIKPYYEGKYKADIYVYI